jgi:hypothetical protein
MFRSPRAYQVARSCADLLDFLITYCKIWDMITKTITSVFQFGSHEKCERRQYHVRVGRDNRLLFWDQGLLLRHMMEDSCNEFYNALMRISYWDGLRLLGYATLPTREDIDVIQYVCLGNSSKQVRIGRRLEHQNDKQVEAKEIGVFGSSIRSWMNVHVLAGSNINRYSSSISKVGHHS